MKMEKNKQILVILLIISVGMTIGVWYYQDSQLKDMEELLRIAGEEYSTLDRMYAELDGTYNVLYSEFTYISEEFSALYKAHTDLEDSIPGIIEDSILLGYNEGNVVGYKQGTIDGEIAGYENGYDTGSEDGYSSGIVVGRDEGYSLGVSDGAEAYAVGEYDGIYWFVRDPTYNELQIFLQNDNTENMEYITWVESPNGYFVCADYAITLKINAFYAGYRCFYVSVDFPDHIGFGHALNAFNTSDRGIVFIDPQNDRSIELEVGEPYWDRDVYEPPQYDDTIIRISLVP